jgi:hypothetical protein
MKSELTIRNCIFAFKCDAVWEDLHDIFSDDYIDTEKVKFCSTCQKEVFLSDTDEELVNNVRLNRCVAIFRTNNNYVERLTGEVADVS